MPATSAHGSRPYLPGGMGSPHPPANHASHAPGRPLIIISGRWSVTFAGHFAHNTNVSIGLIVILEI